MRLPLVFQERLWKARDAQSDDIVASAEIQRDIINFRAAYFGQMNGRAVSVNGQSFHDALVDLTPKLPIDYHVYQQTHPTAPMPNLAFVPNLLPSWTTYQHKALLVAALTIAVFKEASRETLQCMEYAKGELRRHLTEVVAVTHPVKAAELVHSLDTIGS